MAEQPTLECTRVTPTSTRPGSAGTYIVRLSKDSAQTLKAKNGAYLRVSYGDASALARLSIDDELDAASVRIDQTLRHALCLEQTMQGSGKRELVYGDAGGLQHPIVLRRSAFRGPTLLARLVKQQYLVCVVHHAMPSDMETPIARLTDASMQVLGIEPGHKILLITEKGRRGVRCLPVPGDAGLPLTPMRENFTAPCPASHYKDMRLPWVTLDLQTRLELGVEPWDAIFVGRDAQNALAAEFGEVALAVALAAAGGAIVIPEGINRWLPLSVVLTGALIVGILIMLKIRSRI